MTVNADPIRCPCKAWAKCRTVGRREEVETGKLAEEEMKAMHQSRRRGTHPVSLAALLNPVRLVRRFFRANERLCTRVAHILPQAQVNLHQLYVETVARYMSKIGSPVIVDSGGGARCHFAQHRLRDSAARIIAVDISAEELARNVDVDEKRIADITRELPFSNEEADLVVSRSVLEHLTTVDPFVAEAMRILKHGGYFIIVFPSKFAPFSLANQLLPNAISKRMIDFVWPERKGVLGFPAFYDRCYVSAMETVLRECGFEIIESHVGYYQSSYFNFFLPLFLLSALWEAIVRSVAARNLAANCLIVARKK
jgi:SAM-dependent methyltransferase